MSAKGSSYFAYVGCRTTRERNARGDGINVYRVDASTGRWTHVQLIPGLLNPSYLAFDRTRRFLYTVHGDASEVSAFSRNEKTGELKPINRESTDGKNPVHLSIDATNRWIVVANHITSTLAVLPRNADGSIGKLTDLFTLKGKIGPHRVEQPFAKPHQVEFDRTDRFIVVPDKGLDQTFTFQLDADKGKLIAIAAPAPISREGAGPRHVVFHPSNRLAYIVNELDSTISACRFDPESGAVTPIQIVSALPDTFTGNSRASEIAVSPDGRFVYASNRGYDSVAIFAVEAASGRLSQADWAPSKGKTPRFFTLDPRGTFMFVANEDSDTIINFRVDNTSGKLTPTGDEVKTGSPVCIIMTEAS